jgi:hypothetical protein
MINKSKTISVLCTFLLLLSLITPVIGVDDNATNQKPSGIIDFLHNGIYHPVDDLFNIDNSRRVDDLFHNVYNSEDSPSRSSLKKDDTIIAYNQRPPEFGGGSESISGFTEEYEALSPEEKQIIRERERQFFEQYTFNVTTTTIIRDGEATIPGTNEQILVVETIYESGDAKFIQEFGTNTISSSESLSVTQDVYDVFLEEQAISSRSSTPNERVFETVEVEQIILVSMSTPHEWWLDGYAYPPHLYKKENFGIYGDYTKREDPVNLIWKNTTATTVRSTLIAQSGWITLNESLTNEYPYAVYDRNRQWISSLSVANDTYRINGGYHVRIYQLQDGSVVGGAHKDSPVGLSGHQVTDLEYTEYLVCDYFYKANWKFNQNYINLYNSGTYGSGAYNNGNATLITR